MLHPQTGLTYRHARRDFRLTYVYRKVSPPGLSLNAVFDLDRYRRLHVSIGRSKNQTSKSLAEHHRRLWGVPNYASAQAAILSRSSVLAESSIRRL